MSSIFNEFHPVIEYADPVYNNPRDAVKVIYRCKGDPVAIIKWCRRNFGNRGDGWDYSGAGKSLDITIWSSKLITMYELWQV